MTHHQVFAVELVRVALHALGREADAVDERAVRRLDVLDKDLRVSRQQALSTDLASLLPNLGMRPRKNFRIKVGIALAWDGLGVGLAANLDLAGQHDGKGVGGLTRCPAGRWIIFI